MRIRWYIHLSPLLVIVVSTFWVHALATHPNVAEIQTQDPTYRLVIPRGEHGHHNHHSAPLLVLNETEVTLYHAPTPPSYYTLDWESDSSEIRHPGLMISHALFMCLAFFVFLPIAITLRSVRHAGHGIAMLTFYALCALGCSMSALYTKLTPNMYKGSTHGKHGYLILFLAISLSAIDILKAGRRFVAAIRSSEKKTFKLFWRSVVSSKGSVQEGLLHEYADLVQEPEQFDEMNNGLRSSAYRNSGREVGDTAQWANEVHHQRLSSTSDRTLYGSTSPADPDATFDDVKHSHSLTRVGLLRRAGELSFMILERSLVFAGFGLLLTGIVIYTGGCRENYENGCLAHLIKGGIFWSYGLASFARFLGSFADRGWAWNISPVPNIYSAEFVESFVIFFYGATNMWMERFGAHAGDPFSTKQIQHISIAVMFCFAGLVGLGIESKIARKWLASSIFSSSGHQEIEESITEPRSYIGSFNPFPALVIGVTGVAMSAHAQTYIFQVQIHALWGNLLLGFAVLRCLTYFFLWLGPPRSLLPSRPPTEALGSFFLACGGLVFMFSTEEVTIAAMRRGRDDVMMFLNVAVAITCFAFCWTLFIVTFKGWMKSRSQPFVRFRSAA